jgi:Transglutaminase-like superfamily
VKSNAQSSIAKLRLASHVRACRSDDQVILLDLRRDKYLAVGGTQMRVLAAAVEGWPEALAVADMAPSSANVSKLTDRMLLQGLLTDQPLKRERLPHVTVPEATASLDVEDAIEKAAIGPRRLFRFLHSATAAAASLRGRSMLAVVQAVATRRARLAKRQDEPCPLDAARSAVAVYERLRPLVFTSRDKCLFDSLALINFLAHERMFPRWVIGVTTHPFAAHAWVQSEGVVINDLHERVRSYTPILVV